MSEMKAGKLPENSLKRSVLRQIGGKGKEVQSGAGIGRDCAILAFQENEELTVSMQEAALIRKGRKRADSGVSDLLAAEEEPGAAGEEDAEIETDTDTSLEPYMTLGELMQKCANNLAAGGSRPFAFLVTLLMPEGTEEGDVRALMAEAADKAQEISGEMERVSEEPAREKSRREKRDAPVKIIGGQTRITGGITFPYGVVTGLGKLWRDTDRSITEVHENRGSSTCQQPDRHNTGAEWRKVLPGQDVVLSKWIGLQGTAVLAERNRKKLSERYPGWLAEEAADFGRYLSVLPEAEVAVRAGAGAMHDASEGGILGALWELAEGAGTGLAVDMRKLPLRQETVEICECCGVNPYELLSGGCLIMTAPDGPALVKALEKAGIPGTVVGKVTDSKDRILLNGEEVRYMDRPQRDGIYHR